MSYSPLRYKRLIKEIPKHKTAREALLASGFTEGTASKQSKRVLQSAIKYEAKGIMERSNTGEVKGKQLMSDLLGLSSNDLFSLLVKIATQDKDYGSALKVLVPVVREHGIVLSAEEEKNVIAPTLNIIVDKTPDELPVIDGNVNSENNG